MNKYITIIFILTVPLLIFGQNKNDLTDIKRNSFYFEAFGQGLYDSFTFDRLYNVDGKVKTSFSAGLTIIPHPDLVVLATPISYNILFGKKNHHLELGLGFTPMYLRQGNIHSSEIFINQYGVSDTNNFKGHENDFYFYFTPKIGYRFQKPNGGLFVRLTFTPPIAGINIIGTIKGGKNDNLYDNRQIQYFTSAAIFDYFVMPWGGISIGWTFKK